MKIYFLLFLLFLTTNLFAQKTVNDYYNESKDLYQLGKIDSALQGFLTIIENHPKNQRICSTLQHISHIYFIQKKYEKKIEIDKLILDKYCYDFDSKRFATIDLSIDYELIKNYDQALHYCSLYDSLFYNYFNRNFYSPLKYAYFYQKLNQPYVALEKLLPAVLVKPIRECSVFVSEDSSLVLDELNKLLILNNLNKKSLIRKLDKALKLIYPKTVFKYDGFAVEYFFVFLNVEIPIPKRYISEKFNLEDTILKIKKSEFYRLINSF